MRIVGLTGGIVSGKSIVSNHFKAHGVPVVDATIVANKYEKQGAVLEVGISNKEKHCANLRVPFLERSHFLVQLGCIKERDRWMEESCRCVWEEILQDDGEVDRPKLGQTVFSDPAKRLNRLLAPYISSDIFREILELWLKGHKIIVLDIPLLFEAKMDKWTKPIVVVWVDPETQPLRLMARDRTSEEDTRNRIDALMPLDLNRSKADIVIHNTGSLEELTEQFQKALFQVMRPLTWTEFALSRQGALLVLFSITVGVLAYRKASL